MLCWPGGRVLPLSKALFSGVNAPAALSAVIGGSILAPVSDSRGGEKLF